jgi:uncharacterized protein
MCFEQLIARQNTAELALQKLSALPSVFEKPEISNKTYLTQAAIYARRLRPYYKGRKAFRFFLDALIHGSLYKEWFDYVEKRVPQGAMPDAGRLIQKPSMRYLRLWFSRRKKVRVIRSHYGILSALFAPEILRRLHQSKGILLAELTGKSGRDYKIMFHHYSTKEGEIAFHFIDTTLDIPLATVRGTFSAEAENRIVFWIGSLQGPPPPFGRKEISAATRDLHTLRPKQAVLHVVCALCAWMGIRSIYAPRRKNHVSQSWRRFWLGNRKIFADYDKFWEEFSAHRTPWDDFELSLPLPRRNLEDVQSKRRKEWVQRYARIDALTESTVTVLYGLSLSSANG